MIIFPNSLIAMSLKNLTKLLTKGVYQLNILLNKRSIEVFETLKTCGVYYDPKWEILKTGPLPEFMPFNREIEGKQYTFMKGDVYRSLCFEKGIKVKNFARRDDDSVYEYIASIFGTSVTDASELPLFLTNSEIIINKRFNNPERVGMQVFHDNIIDTRHKGYFYCRLPFTIKGNLACAKINSEGWGRLECCDGSFVLQGLLF